MGNKLLGHELETPLINAAGLVNGSEVGGVLRDIETLASTSIGAITVGSFTVEPRMGNAHEYGHPVEDFNRDTGAMVNALGLPNIGIDEAARLVTDIRDAAGDKQVIFSVSPVNSDENIGSPVEQSVHMVERLIYSGAALVELNVSCPNIVTESGDRKSIMGHDVETMDELVEALYDRPNHRDFVNILGIKLPPYLSVEELRAQQKVEFILSDAPIGFLTTSNTIPGEKPVNEHGEPVLSVPKGVGGKSGPATMMEGRLQLALWNKSAPDLPIISTLGVYDGEEVAAREAMGATAVEMNTRLYRSRNWQATIAEVLDEYAQFQD